MYLQCLVRVHIFFDYSIWSAHVPWGCNLIIWSDTGWWGSITTRAAITFDMISNVAMSYVLYDISRYRYYITFNRRQETSSFDHLHFTTIAMEYYELFNPIPISLPSLSPSSIQPLPLEAYINLDDILTPAPCTNLLEVLTTSRGKPMIVPYVVYDEITCSTK